MRDTDGTSVPPSLGQSQEEGGSSAWHQQPCGIAGAAQACCCFALSWLNPNHRISHRSHFCFSVYGQENTEPGQSKSPGVPSIFPPSGPHLQGAEQGSEAAGGTELSHFHCKESHLSAPWPAFPCSFDLWLLFYCRRFEHPSSPLPGSSAETECSLRGLGEGMGWMFPERPPGMCRGAGTAGSVPPISGHRRGCLRDGGRAEPRRGGVQRGSGFAAVGSCGWQGDAEVAAREWPGPTGEWSDSRGSGRTRRASGRTPSGERPGPTGERSDPTGSGPVPPQAPGLGGAAPGPPHRGENIFACPRHADLHNHTLSICINTPRRYPYLAGIVPSRFPIGGRRPRAPPPYIRRAAGSVPRSALSASGGTGPLLLPPLPPP